MENSIIATGASPTDIHAWLTQHGAEVAVVEPLPTDGLLVEGVLENEVESMMHIVTSRGATARRATEAEVLAARGSALTYDVSVVLLLGPARELSLELNLCSSVGCGTGSKVRRT